MTNGTGRLVETTVRRCSGSGMEIGDAFQLFSTSIDYDGAMLQEMYQQEQPSPPITPKYNDADAYINREWVVSTPTITSTSLQGTYVNSDAVGTASNIKGCISMGGGEWNFTGFAGAANSVTATTTNSTDVILSGQNFFGKTNLKVFLQGPYNTTTGLMNTTLNSSGILQANATTSPYLDAPATVGTGFCRKSNNGD
ncbi:MAG: hypothetical protein IPJ13_04040 [Saprospiraceae bacterium]|nr:hypothetical protein [Saprospiraceae bacterium]